MWLPLPLCSLPICALHAQQAMSYRDMAEQMQMDDTARFGKVMLDQMEWRGAGAAWDAQGWYGSDDDKLWVKTEGRDETRGAQKGIQDASLEVLWNRVVSPWWTAQAGARQDLGPGARTWFAVGVQGLAPQWVETEATLYAGDAGHTAARLKAAYDLLLTQRLVLQPFVEANLYGRTDVSRQIGSGLSDVQFSVRLRYELRRELAPYAGAVWLRRLGATADLVRAAGGEASELQWTVGLHAWL